jgi:Protein of unknown function (DUF1501)
VPPPFVISAPTSRFAACSSWISLDTFGVDDATLGVDSTPRMQTAALEAFDLSKETEETKKLYGINQNESAKYGTRCLLARRLVERGVRFLPSPT